MSSAATSSSASWSVAPRPGEKQAVTFMGTPILQAAGKDHADDLTCGLLRKPSWTLANLLPLEWTQGKFMRSSIVVLISEMSHRLLRRLAANSQISPPYGPKPQDTSIYIDNVSLVLSFPITLSAMNYLMCPPCCRGCISRALGLHNVSCFRSTSLFFFPIYIRSSCNSRPRGEIRELAKGGNENLVFILLALLS